MTDLDIRSRASMRKENLNFSHPKVQIHRKLLLKALSRLKRNFTQESQRRAYKKNYLNHIPMPFETKQEVLDWYERQPRTLTPEFLDSIDWKNVREHTIDDRLVPVLY